MSLEDEVVVSDIEVAGRMLTECIARDLRFASCDLQDALDAARYSSSLYTSPPKEWPPIVDVINARELPPVLIERYNAAGGQGTALCGIFPEIRRAWATVDNTLFLWRFDKWYAF
jgi:nuclear pore complex protein Nup155